MNEREKVSINKARSFGATMTVVDADVRGIRGGKHLTLILETGIGLNDGNREVPGGVRFQVHMPQ